MLTFKSNIKNLDKPVIKELEEEMILKLIKYKKSVVEKRHVKKKGRCT